MKLTNRLAGTDEEGFTLIEMMVSLLVVGILMTIAIPTLRTHMARADLRGGAREVVEVLRGARDSALNEQLPRYVLFTPPRTYRLYKYDPSNKQWVAERNAQTIEETVSFTAASITLPSLSNLPEDGSAAVPADAAYFGTRGRHPQKGPFTIELTGGGGLTRKITIYGQTGQVTGV